MEINVSFINQLQAKQREGFAESLKTPVFFYGGAKGGGKSYLMRAREYFLRLMFPGTKGLIVRKSYPELLSNHIRKFFIEYPETRAWYKKAEKAIEYPNGSITEFSYLSNTDDVYTYQGREYENISIDEITQHEEEVFKILRTSNRTTQKALPATMLLTGNPGGIGHTWIKRMFIDRQFRPDEIPEDFKFLQAKVYDNTALMESDPEYVHRLEGSPEHLRKAYLDGDWNIFAGLGFPELTSYTHLVDPFDLPPYTKYYAGYDPGYTHPFAFVIIAVTPDGTVYVTQCISTKETVSRDQFKMILDLVGERSIQIYSGHDLWYPGRGGGASQFEEFAQLAREQGVTNLSFIRAKVDRESGVRQIRRYINPKNSPDGKPKLFFFRNTADVFNTVASMQLDQKNPEDVVKVDADAYGNGGDDYYDAFRYVVMSRVQPGLVEEKSPKKNTFSELKQWIEDKEVLRSQEVW
jgi:phage terminase large subunit